MKYIKIRFDAYSCDIGGEGIHINHSVDTSISESTHATIMVGISIDMVDTNRVGTQFLHQGSIPGALVGVDQRVIREQLVGDALDEELFTLTSKELIANSLNGWDCAGKCNSTEDS